MLPSVFSSLVKGCTVTATFLSPRRLLARLLVWTVALMALPFVHAQSCFVGDFFPMDINWVGPGSTSGLIPVDPNPNDGVRQIRSIQVDTDGNGSAETTFALPIEAQDATNYFLSPSRTFLLATGCPNVIGCSSSPPYTSATIALVRLSGGVAATVHTDCLGGGVLNGNGRWFEAGLCLPDQVSLPTRRVCTTSPMMQVNASGCNRLFMARSIGASGDAELHWYDLNNTSSDTTDGRGVTLLRRQTNDPDLTIDAGGNAAFVRHDIAAGATTYDAAIIDTCPGSPLFGQDVGGDPSLDDLAAASGVVRARVSMCPTAAARVEVLRSGLSGDEVVHEVVLGTCASCANSPPPTGRCCTSSGCAVTTLANCAAGADGWTTGATCATACPAPAPVLSLRLSGAASAPAGQPVTITLTARNSGNAPGTNVRVRLVLNNFYYTSMSADNSGVVTSSDVTWTIGTLSAGESRVVRATFRPVCLTSSPIPIAGSLLSNNGTFAAMGAYDLIVTRPAPAALTGSLVSIPSSDPLVPGSTVTHTMTLTNSSGTTVAGARFSVTLGSGMFFGTVLNSGGGVLTPSGLSSVGWTGDVTANSTTTIAFRAIVHPCPFGALRATQFNEPGHVVVTSICSDTLVDLGLGARFGLIPSPLALEFVAVAGSGVGVGSGLTGAGNTDVLIRDGAAADVTLRLTNQSASEAMSNAQMAFNGALDPMVPPLGANAPSGASYDAATGVLSVSAALAPGQALDVPMHLALAPSQSCRATVTARGGVGPCSGSNANASSQSLTLHRVYGEPTDDHLVTFDYIDGLYTFRPGMDTDLRRFLCFGFSGGGSGAIARTSTGKIVMTSPPALFDPAALTVRPLPALNPTPAAIAWDAATETLVVVRELGASGRRVDRLDLATDVATALVSADVNLGPNGRAEGLAVGGDGRVAWLAGTTNEMRVADTRPPAMPPVAASSSIALTFGAGATPVAIAVDSGGNYVVTLATSNGQRVGVARVDYRTLAIDLIAPDIGARADIPTTCTAVLGTSTVCFGSVLPGSLVSVDLGTPLMVRPNTLSGFPGVLDMVASGRAAPRCVADLDDGSGTGTPDGGVTIEDLLYYLDLFAQGGIRADLDDGSGTGHPDGGVTIDDLLYFFVRYDAGC